MDERVSRNWEKVNNGQKKGSNLSIGFVVCSEISSKWVITVVGGVGNFVFLFCDKL